MRITKRELQEMIDESVEQKLNEIDTHSQQQDFSRQICEFIKEKAKVIGCNDTELANTTINSIKNYFKLK